MFFPQVEALKHKAQGLVGKAALALLLLLILAGSLIACVVVLCCAAYSAMASHLGQTYALLLMGLGLFLVAGAGALGLLLWLRPKHPRPAAAAKEGGDGAGSIWAGLSGLPPVVLPASALLLGVLLGASRWFRAQVVAQATSPLGLMVLRELQPHLLALLNGVAQRGAGGEPEERAGH